MMRFEFEEIAADSIPMEELRTAFGALIKHFGLEVLRKEGFYGGPEYIVRPKSRLTHWATPIDACVHCKQLPCACAVALSISSFPSSQSDYDKLTADEIKRAALAKGVVAVDHHNCSICYAMVKYIIRSDGSLWFSPACNCSWAPAEPRSWQEVVDWIRMQANEENKADIARKFGLP